jgi:multicomponent Na+:H+ antiporter subunit F
LLEKDLVATVPLRRRSSNSHRSAMNAFYHAFAIFLLLNLAGGFVRIVRGPTREDRMVAAQLFGTTGVAVILVLAAAADAGPLRDVALAFVLLAVVNASVFVRSARPVREPVGSTRPSSPA